MKQKLIILFTLISAVLYAQKATKKYYAYAMSGLKIRSHPSMDSTVLTKIKFGDTIRIIEEDKNNPEIIVNGLKGRYVLVNYNGIQGYTYSGYLSRLPAPNLTNRWVTLKDYLNDRFEILGKKTPFKEPNPNDSTITKYGIRYSGNIDYYYFGEECSDIEVIKTKNITLQEAFLLISTFNPNFSDILINKSLRKGNGPKDLWIEQKPKREQYARSLTIEIGNDGEYKSMQICFDAEAGSGCVSVQRKNKDEIIIEFSYSCS